MEELAVFANVSVDVIKAAIKLREQQMMKEKAQQQQRTSKPSYQFTKERTTTSLAPAPLTLPYNAMRKSIQTKKGHKV